MPFHELCHFLVAEYICKSKGIEAQFYVGKNCFFMSETDNESLCNTDIRLILIAGSFGKVIYLIGLKLLMYIIKFPIGILALKHTIILEVLCNWNPILPIKKTNDCKEFIAPQSFRNAKFPGQNFSFEKKHNLIKKYSYIFVIVTIISVIVYTVEKYI